MPPKEKNGRSNNAEALLAVVNAAAPAVGARFITFLTVCVYISVIVSSTTDEMLVHAKAVTLPLLNAPIPVSGVFGFYMLAPWLIVFLHWDVLLQLSTLRNKVVLFRRQADRLPDHGDSLYQRVASFYYLQFFLGHGSAALQILSTLIIWLSVIVLPLVLLLVIQVRFLSFHNPWYSFFQRAAVAADVALILVLWRRLSARDAETLWRAAPWRARLRRFMIPATWLLGGSAVAFCFAVALIPDEWHEAWVRAQLELRLPETWSRMWFEARNLSLQGEDLTDDHLSARTITLLGEDSGADEREQELANVSERNFLQGRDLRYAKLYQAVLPKFDLRSQRVDGELIVTRLSDADLRFALMERVLLDQADLQRANLESAQLQGGSLMATRLQHANLSKAQIADAKLGGAILQCAHLSNAKLQGADLAGAFLEGADLSSANLQGAILRGADLRGAELSQADLRGADLSEAHLEDANLDGARLQGALLSGAHVRAAQLDAALSALAWSGQLRVEDALRGSTPAATQRNSRFEAVCRAMCDAGRIAEIIAAETCVPNAGIARAVQIQADHRLDLGASDHAIDEPSLPGDGPDSQPTAADLRANGAGEIDCSLVDIACDDPYAARGLSRQAMDRQNSNRRWLVAALQQAAARKECAGLQHLPEGLRTALKEAAALPADGSAPGPCGDSPLAGTTVALIAHPSTDPTRRQ